MKGPGPTTSWTCLSALKMCGLMIGWSLIAKFGKSHSEGSLKLSTTVYLSGVSILSMVAKAPLWTLLSRSCSSDHLTSSATISGPNWKGSSISPQCIPSCILKVAVMESALNSQVSARRGINGGFSGSASGPVSNFSSAM